MFSQACIVCERRNYIPELVYLLSKTGETKRALFLIIDKLGDVSQAISFAKTQNDRELWNDLLDYSMDKPRFIRGLLEEVGTAIDPVTLVRRIPEGLEVEGLKSGLSKILKEYELQYSISEGVARIFRGEVALGLENGRMRRRKAVKFDVGRSTPGKESETNADTSSDSGRRCVGCKKVLMEDGTSGLTLKRLLGFEPMLTKPRDRYPGRVRLRTHLPPQVPPQLRWWPYRRRCRPIAHDGCSPRAFGRLPKCWGEGHTSEDLARPDHGGVSCRSTCYYQSIVTCVDKVPHAKRLSSVGDGCVA